MAQGKPVWPNELIMPEVPPVITATFGLATAKRFVAEGAYVFIMGRRQQSSTRR